MSYSSIMGLVRTMPVDENCKWKEKADLCTRRFKDHFTAYALWLYKRGRAVGNGT